MGVLIVVGLTVVIVTIVKRYGGNESGANPTSQAGVSVPVERGFGERRITTPKGAKVVETIIDGNRLVLRLNLADGAEALLLIDATTGQRTGLIRLDPQQ